MNTNVIKELVNCFSLIKSCDSIFGGFQIETPFQYPDGSNIKLLFKQNEQLNWCLTDGDSILDYLFELEDEEIKEQQFRINLIIDSLDVQMLNREFLVEFGNTLPSGLDFSDAIVRLSLVCIRITNLEY